MKKAAHTLRYPQTSEVFKTSEVSATQNGCSKIIFKPGTKIRREIEIEPLAARQLRWWTGGYESHPTVQIGGDILVEPSTAELHWALARNGLA